MNSPTTHLSRHLFLFDREGAPAPLLPPFVPVIGGPRVSHFPRLIRKREHLSVVSMEMVICTTSWYSVSTCYVKSRDLNLVLH